MSINKKVYFRVNQFRTKPWINEDSLINIVKKKIRNDDPLLKIESIEKRSFDLRKDGCISWNFIVSTGENSSHTRREIQNIHGEEFIPRPMVRPYALTGKYKTQEQEIHIIGAGICGIMAAYHLAKIGFKPVVFEQGEGIKERNIHVKELHHSGILRKNSNIQFGLGGAGTFSDGKVNSRTKSPLKKYFLNLLVKYGGKKDLIFDSLPHAGTDGIRKIVQNIHDKIIEYGGKFVFNTKVDELIIKNGKYEGVKDSNGVIYNSNACFLAVGNASRDMFRNLHDLKVPLKAKPIAMGFRIEHEQRIINKIQYKNSPLEKYFGAATYSVKSGNNQNLVYSFCVCPGGMIVNSSVNKEEFSINGMSFSGRGGKYINAAIVTGVEPRTDDDPLEILKLQEKFEKRAGSYSSGKQLAPAQDTLDFIFKGKGKLTHKTTFRPGVVATDLSRIYPNKMNAVLRNAFQNIDNRMRGFADSALIGVETRTSSPLWILRNDNFESPEIEGLYPCGEGSGYAGGILTSGIDGIMAVDNFLKKYEDN